MLFSLLTAMEAGAQAFRSQFTSIRATIPVNSINSTVLGGPTNTVILVGGVTNAVFDVSGLPPGASAVLTDGNGNSLLSTTQSTNLWITLNTTNIPEGTYNFTLNIGGYDTNGVAVTNQFPFVLQAAHIWAGGGAGETGFGVSNNWANAASWLGGVPAAADDVVFSDSGAQTNAASYGIGKSFNVGIDASMTVASLRFAQDTFTNDQSTNILYHSIKLAPGATLAVVGTNAAGGMSLLRDTIGEFGFTPDDPMGVYIAGTNATLMVSNTAANFSVLLGSSEQPTLNMTNLGTFVCDVDRVSLSDFRGYPNYNGLNAAYNAGRDPSAYAGLPRRMWANIFLARTNFFRASYVDPDNYTNEYTRTYALTLQNNEQAGNGSSVNTFFYLGRTNVFFLDSICFVGSSSASGNTGGTKFNPFNEKNATNPGALFRGPDGVSRMSMFCVSDDGGTNNASSNVKSTTDFSYGNFTGTGGGSGYVDLLADRLYVARDRTMIASNQSPNVQGDLIFGSCTVDVNTAFLGCQEHSNKVDWTSLDGASPYLNYCQGRLVVTNWLRKPSIFKVNGNLTLGYTADMNPVASAQQYNTYGQLTIYSNVTFMVSNVVCDGGLNYYDGNGRKNTITINQGELVVSNTIGYPNLGASDFSAADPRGMRLDTLTMNAGTLTVFADSSKINVYTRTLLTPGIVPSIIKVAGLNNVSSFPAQLPIISYMGTAAPFMNANVSSLGTGYYGYILNNSPNSTVDLYVTTNSPNTLIWTGAQSSHWNTTDLNWVTAVGHVQTNFHLGDLVAFDDSSSVTNITIDDSVVPGQTGVGVTISNTVNQYVFSGGTIAGTALVSKDGTNSVEFDATEQGPITIMAGLVTGSGQLGTATVYSNVVVNFTGGINGGLTSTGTVVLAGSETGPVSIQGGYLDNSGEIDTTANQIIQMAPGTAITNEMTGTINVGVGAGAANSFTWDVPHTSVLANFGQINLYQPRVTVEGLLFGNGTISDPNGGGHESIANGNAPLVRIQPLGEISPGLTPLGSISSMNLQCRFDYQNDPKNSPYGVGTVRIEVDFNNPQKNDVLNIDRWNNDTGLLLMTNINPSAGSFQEGQSFQVFDNSNSGDPFNSIDTLGFAPTIKPYIPGPGLQWGITNFNLYGVISVVKTPMVWDGSGSSTWDTNGSTGNWKSGTLYTDNQGAVFDDSASGSTMVTLLTNVAPESYPSVGYTNYITNVDLTITTNIDILSNQPAVYPGIIISNATKDYVIAGPGHIKGITGIYKTGPGRATLMTSNDFIGNVIIDNGTLAVTNYGLLGNLVSLGIAGAGQMENDVILDGGTLDYVGTTNVSIINQFVIMDAGGTVSVSSPTNTLLFNTGQKQIVGTGVLTKSGPGTLALFNANDNYQGGTVVNDGALDLRAGGAGPGSITLNNTAMLLATNTLNITNDLVINGPATTLQTYGTLVRTNICDSDWSGSGTVLLAVTNMFVFDGDMSGFSGTLSVGDSSGTFQFNYKTNANPCLGSAAATFDLGTGSAILQTFNGSNLTYSLGALMGGPNTILSGRTTNSASPAGTIFSIGGNGLDSTFSGVITNGSDTVSVVKVGTGTLLLNGINWYTGPTTVSSGTLGGTGAITSPLTVSAGGTLSPGSPVGTFTVNNDVTLSGATIMELNNSSTPVNDKLVVTGTLTGGGALIVTNVGPDLVNGTKFTLFSKPVTGFSSVTLPVNNPSHTSTYTWNNTLSTDGAITLVSGGTTGVNMNPTNITATVSGGVLTLSWPADHLGWHLQVQTNSTSTGLSNNWYEVPGSTSVDSEMINIDANAGSVFYRLVSQ